eukprot:TRINITY_DN2275_c0_g1_i4.p1 TRINITY_DN2275_c0_g1~~TRINITY_DN2275_c0_g1_i4.p1  ORF type:complete len:119 (+),score=14.32 TRINITY_DN2275_c0_g1_i4:85-441(+)
MSKRKATSDQPQDKRRKTEVIVFCTLFHLQMSAFNVPDSEIPLTIFTLDPPINRTLRLGLFLAEQALKDRGIAVHFVRHDRNQRRKRTETPSVQEVGITLNHLSLPVRVEYVFFFGYI